MCSQKTIEIIQEVVTEHVDSDELFTALDVSVKVQSILESKGLPFERHRNLKSYIHQEMNVYLNSGLYERKLYDVGGNNNAFVYYPSDEDMTDYVHKAIPKIRIPVSKGRMPDARGTIGVPSEFVRKAGFNEGQVVQVHKNVNVLEIVQNSPNKLASYTVLSDDRIRINRKTLSLAFQNADNGYEFGCVDDKIIVKKM